MPVKRTLTFLLGVAGVLPLAFFVAYPAYFFPRLMHMAAFQDRTNAYLRLWDLVSVLMGGTLFLIFALLIFYVILANRSEAVPEDKRRFWTLVLLIGNVIAFPVFWYLFLWRPRTQGAA
jgi:hypothetical protein